MDLGSVRAPSGSHEHDFAVQIGDFEEFGRGLVIDGTVQLCSAIDPAVYRGWSSLAALLADSRKRWLIIGGGDGATAREALRFATPNRFTCRHLAYCHRADTSSHPFFFGPCQHDSVFTLMLPMPCLHSLRWRKNRARWTRRGRGTSWSMTCPIRG